MKFKQIVATLALLCLVPAGASAQSSQFAISMEEHAACDVDAYQFCSTATDMDGLLACMRTNRPNLTPKCRTVFNAGLKARHLPI